MNDESPSQERPAFNCHFPSSLRLVSRIYHISLLVVAKKEIHGYNLKYTTHTSDLTENYACSRESNI